MTQHGNHNNTFVNDSELEHIYNYLLNNNYDIAELFIPEIFIKRLRIALAKIDICSFNEFTNKYNSNIIKYLTEKIICGETELFRDEKFWSFLITNPEICFHPEKKILFFDQPTAEEIYSWIIINDMLKLCNTHKITINTPHYKAVNNINKGLLSLQKRCIKNKLNIILSKDIQLANNIINNGKKLTYKPLFSYNININTTNILQPIQSKSLNIIFCRNRLLYYKNNYSETISANLYRALKKDGYLFAGTHENRQIWQSTGLLLINEKLGIYKKNED